MWAVEQVSARSDVLRRRSGGQARPRLPYVTSLGSGGQARPRLPYVTSLGSGGQARPRLPYAASLGSGGQARPSSCMLLLSLTRADSAFVIAHRLRRTTRYLPAASRSRATFVFSGLDPTYGSAEH